MTDQTGVTTSGDGLIDPSLFPCKSADLDTSDITDSAKKMRRMGSKVKTEVDSIKRTWSRLPASYQAPEQQQVFDLMNPAVTSASDLKTALNSAAGHLDTYASALGSLRSKLSEFIGRATAFRNRVKDGVYVDKSSSNQAGFGDYAKGAFDWVPFVDEEQVLVPWNADGDTVAENQKLLGEYAGILAQISTAATTCANAINGLVVNPCVAPAEAIPAQAFTNPEQPMPWGSPRDEDRNCAESVGNGASNVVSGTYSGVVSLVGFDTESSQWSQDTAKQSWGGMGNFLLSTAVIVSPLAQMAQTDPNMPEQLRAWALEKADFASAAWSSMIGFDYNAFKAGGDGWRKYKEDAVSAATESALNVLTSIVPAGAAAGGAKVGVTGARVMRMVTATADFIGPFGGQMVNGGVRAFSAARSAIRFGDDVPVNVGGGVRFNPAGPLDDMTSVTTKAPDTTPVTSDLFGNNGGNHAPSVAPELGDSRPGGSAPEPGGSAPEPGGRTPASPVDGPSEGGQTPTNGTTRTPDAPAHPYDPAAPVSETVPATAAPHRYTPADVQQALDNAPVNEAGVPVDPRTGQPLNLTNVNGDRGWEMRWDADAGEWVAQNRGSGYPTGMDPTGTPDSFGYDSDGNLMPYANHRPSYEAGQEQAVFDNTHNAQVEAADHGLLVDEQGNQLPAPGENQVWVQQVDDSWKLITWEPGQPRTGLWDMGHLPDSKYSDLRERYLNHEISLEDFLAEYRDADNYAAADPSRNRSHVDE